MASGTKEDINITLSDRSYVDTVLGAAKATPVEASSKKRHLSHESVLEGDSDTIKKKSKSDILSTERVFAQARRSLYGCTPNSKSKKDQQDVDKQCDTDNVKDQQEENKKCEAGNVDLSLLIVKCRTMLAI